MQAFVIWELIFQLPFFVYGAYDYLRNNRRGYSKSMWVWFLLYGFNAGFTSLICVIEILWNGNSHGLNIGEVIKLALVYFPTTILPFIMMIDFIKRINGDLLSKKKAI